MPELGLGPSVPLEPGFSVKEKIQDSNLGQEGRKEKQGEGDGEGRGRRIEQTETV